MTLEPSEDFPLFGSWQKLDGLLNQTSLNDLDKADEVSKLRSPEMAGFSAGFRSTIPDCGLKKHRLPGGSAGDGG